MQDILLYIKTAIQNLLKKRFVIYVRKVFCEVLIVCL